MGVISNIDIELLIHYNFITILIDIHFTHIVYLKYFDDSTLIHFYHFLADLNLLISYITKCIFELKLQIIHLHLFTFKYCIKYTTLLNTDKKLGLIIFK